MKEKKEKPKSGCGKKLGENLKCGEYGVLCTQCNNKWREDLRVIG